MQTELELIGLFAFGISGALMAIRLDFDAVGIAILAVLTAVGGGILRDLVLGDTPPPAFTQWEYLVVPLAAAAVTFVAHPELERLTRTLLVFDAAGLGLFCVSGTLKALDRGVGPVGAVTLGVTTAVGGGLLRDVIARQTPALVRADSELYAVAALAGAVGVTIALGAQRLRADARRGRRRRRVRHPRLRPPPPLARAARLEALRLLSLTPTGQVNLRGGARAPRPRRQPRWPTTPANRMNARRTPAPSPRA